MESKKEKLLSENYKKRFIVFLLLILAAFIFWSSLSLQNFFQDSVNFLEEYINKNRALGGLVFIGLAALSALFSPFSSTPLIPPAIMIWSSGTVAIMLLSGWLAGDLIAYLIGRFARRTFANRLFSFEKMERYQNMIPTKAQFWLVLLVRFALPTEIVGYVLGIIRYHFGKYFLATFLIEVPFAILAIYSGKALIAGNALMFIGLIALGAAVISVTFYFFKKNLKERDK